MKILSAVGKDYAGRPGAVERLREASLEGVACLGERAGRRTRGWWTR
jgi:hypothetical protein